MYDNLKQRKAKDLSIKDESKPLSNIERIE